MRARNRDRRRGGKAANDKGGGKNSGGNSGGNGRSNSSRGGSGRGSGKGSSGRGGSNRGSSRDDGDDNGNRNKGRNRRKGRRHGAGFWGDPDKLPPLERDVRITDDPSAVPRSLGPPPLPGHEKIAEHYFTAVYERAVATAGALAAAGGLIGTDALEDDDTEV